MKPGRFDHLKDITFKNEKQFQDWLNHIARSLGWAVYHTYDSRRSEPGFPDTVMVRGRRIIFAELKYGKNKPTAAQRKWLDRLKQNRSVEVYLWTDADVEAILNVVA